MNRARAGVREAVAGITAGEEEVWDEHSDALLSFTVSHTPMHTGAERHMHAHPHSNTHMQTCTGTLSLAQAGAPHEVARPLGNPEVTLRWC